MTSTNKRINIVWHFKTSSDRIWQAWTDPAKVKQWFGSDPNGKVLNARTELWVGGQFEVSFMDADKTEHTCSGIYTEFETNSSLLFTWSWKSEPGYISFVKVFIRPEPAGTLMNFEHANLNPGSVHNYEIGWRSTFKKLDRLFENQK